MKNIQQPTAWFSRITPSFLAALTVAIALGTSASAQPDTPYAGTITFDTVKARSGAGRVFYPVADLKAGDQVTVVDGDFFGWFRVSAPGSVVAAVRQVDVEAKGDGSRGVVTADIATVRVRGIGRSAAESFKTLKTISKGDAVEILGRDGDYFLINPPANSLVFLKPGSVKPQEVAPPAIAEFDEPDTTEADSSTDEPVPTSETSGASGVSGGGGGDMVPLDGAVLPDGLANTDTDLAEIAPGLPDVDPGNDVALTTPDIEETPGLPAPETPDLSLTDSAAAGAGTAAVVLPELNDPRDPAPTPTTDTNASEDAAAPAITTDAQAGTENTVTTDTDTDTDATADADTAQVVDDSAEQLVIETPAINPALREVELAMLPNFYKPVEQQPLDEIHAAYEKVNQEQVLVGVDAKIVEARLAAVARNRQFAAALAQIQQRQDAVVRVDPVQVDPAADEPYAAIGILSVSTVLSGSGTSGGPMFRVIDPATRRTIAYVRPAAGIDPAPSVGQIVGIKGSRQYDPSLNNQLIIAQQVRVLDAGN